VGEGDIICQKIQVARGDDLGKDKREPRHPPPPPTPPHPSLERDLNNKREEESSVQGI